MARPRSAVLTAIAVFALSVVPARGQAPSPAGVVKTVTGSAAIVRANEQIPAVPGQRLFQGDTLRTTANGRLGVTLKDGTRLSLGGTTELRLDAFAYAPAEGRLQLALKLLRGVAAYVSGHIAQLSPGAVKIETPSSVIGIRGTQLLIGVDQP